MSTPRHNCKTDDRKLAIDRPCSACSAGDSAMEYHDHCPPFREGVEPTPQIDDAFVEQIEDALGMGHGAWDMVDPVEICKAVAAAVSKNLQEELAKLKLTHEFAELHIAELESEITALREKPRNF